MKTTIRLTALVSVLALLAVGLQAKAGSITNNFDNSLDYMVNGVPGSMWDGVYLGLGDIYGGDGDGNSGFTLVANETANTGYLTVQSSDTDWAGTGDDGFFLFKVVAGDFDVSVENVAPFQNPNYHMSGLLVRAFTASGPHWGAPYGGSENFVFLPRFQEFGVDEDIRYTQNGVDHDGYISVPGSASDTSTSRYLRITRVGDAFSFYTKTNQTDDWALQGTLTRSDLAGAPLQVGIADASFGSASPTTYYTDFELTGTNVASSVVSPANPTGLTATPMGANVSFSWTPGAGSSGSFLVLRKNSPLALQEKPINGYTYAANTNFASGDDIGANIYAVYSGADSSVTVGGLGSTNNSYSAAVYSYSGSGSAIVYGAGPATSSTTGAGLPLGINFTLTPASGLPVGGVAVPVLVTFDSVGDTDTLANASASWSSSDSSILTVAADGTINGVALGTAQVVATYGGFSATNPVTVHVPAYTNNFDTSHNFLAGLAGSTWDGLFLKGGDIPNASFSPPMAQTTVCDANITSNNAITITAANSAWQGANDNGPFLFKHVPGDFQASVHITDYSQLNYEFVGLQARSFSAVDNASPSGPAYGENFIGWLRFDEFGVTTATFNTVNGSNIETDQNDGENTDYWLLMVRASSSNFYFFKKANLTDPWIFQPSETINRPDLTNGAPMEVGLVQSMFTANAGSVQFDSFTLDAVGIASGTPPSATTNLMTSMDSTYTQETLTWTPGTNSDGSTANSLVVMRAGAPVDAQPYYGMLSGPNSVFGQGMDLGGGNYVVYIGGGNTATVTGLTPSVTYYAVVYGYSGSGTAKSFNLVGSAYTNSPPVVFTGITASLDGSIPVSGVGLVSVSAQIQGGGTVGVSQSVQITSGNTNVIAVTNNVLSGLAVGTATNTVTFVFGTSTFTTPIVTVVHAAGYTDNFGTSHDYIANGVTNTTWDGVYAQPGSIPNTSYASDPLASISDADANVTSNQVLNVTSENVGWEAAENDGFFLFKNVAGDFQASVHISYLDASYAYDGGSMVAYNNPGLLARAYNTNGSPYNIDPLTRGETWVSFTRFDLYGIGTYARKNLDNNVTQSTQPGGFNGANTTSDTNLWLLIMRKDATNFLFFQRQSATDPWAPTPNGTTYGITNFAGLSLQVGLLAGGFGSGNQVTVGFDSFMLDQTVSSPALAASITGGNLRLSWPASGTYVLQYTRTLGPTTWLPVTVLPVTANGVNTVTLAATNATAFFRLSQ